MEALLSESPNWKSRLFTTKNTGVTLGDQYLQLFLFLENDGVPQTLISGFPKVPAIHTSQARVGHAPKLDSGDNERTQP